LPCQARGSGTSYAASLPPQLSQNTEPARLYLQIFGIGKNCQPGPTNPAMHCQIFAEASEESGIAGGFARNL
jgi:hypothetical protein